jgi:CBS domain containing-hemolysin-like protein
MSGTGPALIAAALLLLANAFFVAVEFALVAARRTRLAELAEEGSRSARLAAEASHELSLQLAGAQLGITMASLGLGYVAEPALAHLIEAALGSVVEVPVGVERAIGLVIGLTIVVFLHMVVGEMVPKNVAIAAPERTAIVLAIPNRIYTTAFRPVLAVLNAVANVGVRLFGIEPKEELSDARTAEELAGMLAASNEEGLIEDERAELLAGALRFRENTAGSVMVPLDRVTSLPRRTSVAEAERVVARSGHSRVPVYEASPERLTGYVHAKDLLLVEGEGRDRPVPLRLVRPMLVVEEDRSLDDVLLAMKRQRVHVAAVVGEGRSARGVLTLEDVLERLVGAIRDETDQPGS